MQQEPLGNALLECAIDLFRDRLLPTIAADQKHSALMILNAMAIAARQFRLVSSSELDESASLQTLLVEGGEQLPSANKHLAQMIREGAGDPDQPQRQKMLGHLRKIGRQRLAESNPKVLNVDRTR